MAQKAIGPLREIVGTGGAIDTHHQGDRAKRRTEREAGVDDYNPGTGKTPADLRRERQEREARDKAERIERERKQREGTERGG